MRMIAGWACICALSLSACATVAPVTTPTGVGGPAGSTARPGASSTERAEAIRAIATTAATVADAIGQAPPATLSRTTIDEVAINRVFRVADTARAAIDLLLDTGQITPGSPSALRIRDGVLLTRRSIAAASAAQRAGNATTYRAALDQAYAVFTALGTDVAR